MTAPLSTWAPLRIGTFRALWLAVLASNIGTWMQTVGAQWLLVEGAGDLALVALVQTASTLPVLLLALPSGVLADSFDRRRLLLAVQAFNTAVAGALAALTAVGQMPPALLLAFTFALGVGAALGAPAYQALIPDLVPRAQLPSAAALGAMAMNVARAVGPAVAGLVVAGAGVAFVFALNALSFAVFAVVLALWRRPSDEDDPDPERFLAALRAGGRYVRYSPVMRRILLRAVLFIVPASVLWALLALIARSVLDLGAGGYGLLLAALGVGAVLGVVVMARLRALLTVNGLLVLAALVFAVVLAVLVLVPVFTVAVLVLLGAGLAWVAVLSSVNAAIQLFLPNWVRARGLSVYQMTFFGAQALGGVLWGLVASRLGLSVAFLSAAVLLVLGALTVRWWPLLQVADLDRSPAVYWPDPSLALSPDPTSGPVIVTVVYTVPPSSVPSFRAAMARVRRSRLRTGATRWGLYRTGEEPDRFVEFYVVGSWEEHLRQHGGRLTGADRSFEESARAFAVGEPEVRHLFPAGDLP